MNLEGIFHQKRCPVVAKQECWGLERRQNMLPKAAHTTNPAPFQKHKPLTTVDYEQQIDYLTEWINDWDNTEVGKVDFPTDPSR